MSERTDKLDTWSSKVALPVHGDPETSDCLLLRLTWLHGKGDCFSHLSKSQGWVLFPSSTWESGIVAGGISCLKSQRVHANPNCHFTTHKGDSAVILHAKFFSFLCFGRQRSLPRDSKNSRKIIIIACQVQSDMSQCEYLRRSPEIETPYHNLTNTDPERHQDVSPTPKVLNKAGGCNQIKSYQFLWHRCKKGRGWREIPNCSCIRWNLNVFLTSSKEVQRIKSFNPLLSFFFFLALPGIELRTLRLLGTWFYRLSHASSSIEFTHKNPWMPLQSGWHKAQCQGRAKPMETNSDTQVWNTKGNT
jgi:hypothetical protein